MTIKKTQIDANKSAQIVSEARKQQALREQSYRGQALKMYPWICGRCAREFTHTNLSELTVHHRNHNPRRQSRRWQQLGIAVPLLP